MKGKADLLFFGYEHEMYLLNILKIQVQTAKGKRQGTRDSDQEK